ncbi:butyrate kinase [Oceanobacillus jeddahense]|uniref:Probable butyrate kinase n=1 Tax=Oceanobacillus jeddahense TaxID=1462527 RepID=A0ABY5JZ72_9BACI|nr:butyrate kinase [Oceanobacillus jeddahense]UUI05399.1 butyrate kinase [Oceanobacillus jeddahense]
MNQRARILVIYPDLYITTIGVFEGNHLLYQQKIKHDEEELQHFVQLIDQVPYRKQAIFEQLDLDGMNTSRFISVCGRGGLLRPISGGAYKVNDAMLYDLKTNAYGEHVSNLGAILAYEIADNLNITAYIVDPPVVDEMQKIAKYTGIPEIERASIFHSLNHRHAGRIAAKQIGSAYHSLKLISIHIARGITIASHHTGKIIDVTNGVDGEGPFTIDRSGSIPLKGFLSYLTEQYSAEEDFLWNHVQQDGGIKAYLHTEDPTIIRSRLMKEDQHTKEVIEAQAYQIAKEIGAMGTVLHGEVDGIVFTGKINENDFVIDAVIPRINWIADVMVFPGKNDLEAMNEGVLEILNNSHEVKTYVAEEAN